MKLKEQLMAIAKEYARQVAELMEVSEYYFVGMDSEMKYPIGVCDFGGVWFMGLDEMQVIMDNMPRWVKMYGSREEVAKQVSEWFDWWMDDHHPPHPILELWESRYERFINTRPRINLYHWLAGCPRKQQPDERRERLQYLRAARELLQELAREHTDLNAQPTIDEMEDEIRRLDEEDIRKRVKQWMGTTNEQIRPTCQKEENQ